MEKINKIPTKVSHLVATLNSDLFLDFNKQCDFIVGQKITFQKTKFKVIAIQKRLLGEVPNSVWSKILKNIDSLIFFNYTSEKYQFKSGLVSYISLMNRESLIYRLNQYVHIIFVEEIV